MPSLGIYFLIIHSLGSLYFPLPVPKWKHPKQLTQVKANPTLKASFGQKAADKLKTKGPKINVTKEINQKLVQKKKRKKNVLHQMMEE